MLFDIWSGPRFLSNYLLILNIGPCMKQNYSALYTTIHFVSKSTYYLTFSASLSRLNDGIICSLDDRPVDNDNEGVIATTILHYIQFSKILLTFIYFFFYKIVMHMLALQAEGILYVYQGLILTNIPVLLSLETY